MTDLTGTFRKPFAEQVAAFRLRMANLVPTTRWDDLVRGQHDRGFMVAGALKADLLADLAAAVDKAIAQGTTLEEFRRDFRAIVEKNGWHGWTGEGTAKGEAWRTRVIYQTNLRTTYMAGRHAQLMKGNFKYWVYRHSGAAEPRLQHLSWDGVALPPEHPFWATHYPPNGWGCGCDVVGTNSEAGIRRVGGTPGKELPDGWQGINPRTGTPVGIDKGWDYAPGASVVETVAVAAEKIKGLPAALGADFGEQIAPQIAAAWPVWLADTLVKGSHTPGLVGTLSPETVASLALRGRVAQSSEITVSPGLVIGPKALRHELVGDALSADEWLLLPWRLRNPLAVLLDEKSGRLLYVFAGNDRVPMMVIDIAARGAEGVTENRIISAYRPRLTDLIGRIAGGQLTLLRGELG